MLSFLANRMAELSCGLWRRLLPFLPHWHVPRKRQVRNEEDKTDTVLQCLCFRNLSTGLNVLTKLPYVLKFEAFYCFFLSFNMFQLVSSASASCFLASSNFLMASSVDFLASDWAPLGHRRVVQRPDSPLPG